MWDSTASLKMRSRPIRASSTFCGTLPLRKPGILVRRREIGGRVLHGVLHVVDGDLDLEADAVVRELFDLSPHAGHSASHRSLTAASPPERGMRRTLGTVR